MKNFNKLNALITEHPGLRIVPMVNHEVVGADTWGYWMGSWGPAYVERIYCGEERYYIYDEHDMEDLLVEIKGWDWYDLATDDDCLKEYQSLAWDKVIVVYIDTP